ncbi:hypothetical protein [Vibrio owensii]|uniref:hypothetical protein n=1 Tax=Vibrio owensii TaxID=696485 RepID=UPI003CC5733A
MNKEKFINEVQAQTKAKIMSVKDLLAPADQGETVEIEFNLPFGYEMIVMVNSGASRNIEDPYHVEIDLFRSNDKLAASGNQGCLEECNLEDQIIEFCHEHLETGAINESCAAVPCNEFIMAVSDVPHDITEDDMYVTHLKINMWKLESVHKEGDSFVANIRFTTSEDMSEDDLEGEVSVRSKVHTVHGVDVYIDRLPKAA